MNLVSRLSGITGSKADIIHSAFYLPEFNRLSLVLCSLLRCKIIPGSFKKNPHVYHKILFAVIPIGFWIFYHNFVCISRNTAYCTCCQCCDARFFLYFQCVWHEQVAAILAIPCHSSHTVNNKFHMSFLYRFLKIHFSASILSFFHLHLQ